MNKITIGFTGTRSGMSISQKLQTYQILEKLASEYDEITVLHGGCIGSDEDFHIAAKPFIREVYPGRSTKNPDDLKHVGKFEGANIIHSPQPYFKRNRDIVDRCTVLIATPFNQTRQGGTWYTIGYAEDNKTPVMILKR